jgi:hypothetical protein
LNNYHEQHYIAEKRVLRYLKGTKNLGLHYRTSQVDLQAFTHTHYRGPNHATSAIPTARSYSDADFGGTKLDRRSTSGYVNMYSGAAITSKSQLQPTIALSTLEAEYMAMS